MLVGSPHKSRFVNHVIANCHSEKLLFDINLWWTVSYIISQFATGISGGEILSELPI